MESTISAMMKHAQQNRFTEAQGGREIDIPASGFVSKNSSDILSLIFSVDLLAFSQMQYLQITWMFVYMGLSFSPEKNPQCNHLYFLCQKTYCHNQFVHLWPYMFFSVQLGFEKHSSDSQALSWILCKSTLTLVEYVKRTGS